MAHKLLLADDSVTIQRVIELTFADEDVQVTAVGDGKLAIQRIQENRPDIVLADVGMPERDGYEVATFIKGTPELAHIPVLLLTGAFEPIDEGRARAAGCDGVLVKPFEPQLVINRVRELLGARRPAAAASKVQAPAAAAPVQEIPVQPPPKFDPPRKPAAIDSAPASAAPAAPSGSIEDYFDRLDAAFASIDGTAPPGAATASLDSPRPASEPSGYSALADELAGWDPSTPAIQSPDFAWTPAPAAAPANVPEAAPAPAPPRREAAPMPQPRTTAVQEPSTRGGYAAPPTLAEAFAALLAAEQAQPYPPAAARAAVMDAQVIDQITKRVVERLGDRAMKQTVIEVAERLVREEIDRIKAHAR